VESWLRRLPLGKSSCAKIRNLFSVLFNHACRYELFDRIPIRLVRQGAKRRTIPTVLTPAEINTLLSALGLRERTLQGYLINAFWPVCSSSAQLPYSPSPGWNRHGKKLTRPVDLQQEIMVFLLTAIPVDRLKECMPSSKSEVLQGTLDLLVLKTLDSLGPMHGFGIALRIQQVSEDLLQLNQGTLYPALLRLQQRGWITSKWGISENNRKAKYYSLTRAGRKQLEEETESWGRMSAMINRVLRTT
jgi:PadR family transcriptional regulator PadR